MTYGRKAYGAHRSMTPDQKARNIAQSIALRVQEGRPWDWSQYGLENDHGQQRAVLAKLQILRHAAHLLAQAS